MDAFFNALRLEGISGYSFVSYEEQALSKGSDSKAVAYVQAETPEGRNAFGGGVDRELSAAAVKAVICAMARTNPARQEG